MPDFARYALVIDARSEHEYAEDHVPGAINLPVVDDSQYAVVGTMHKDDTHRAYLIGVEHSLRNMADHIAGVISTLSRDDRILVYCFRGGKRSRLWADTLRIIGFRADIVPGGWKAYRRWVRAELERLPATLSFRVLLGATGAGKTRLLGALRAVGAQVLDLEALAHHRGSLIGDLPGDRQPTQKYFDSLLHDVLRSFDPSRPVWVEAESKRIGAVQLPDALYEAIHRATGWRVETSMPERVRLWREDYGHWVEAPEVMVEKLAPLKPLIGGEELELWRELARDRRVDELFERVMVHHYDPAYSRTSRRHWPDHDAMPVVRLESVSPAHLRELARELDASPRAAVAR